MVQSPTAHRNAPESKPLLDSPPPTERSNGYAIMLIAVICYALMSIFARPAQAHFGLSTPAAVLLRGLIGVVLSVLSLSFLSISGVPVQAGLHHPRLAVLLALRGVLGTLGYGLQIAALARIPAGDEQGIYASTPLLTLLLSAAVLRERVDAVEMAATLVALGGMVLVAAPGSTTAVDSVNNILVAPIQRLSGAGLAFSAAAFDACAFVVARHIGERLHFHLIVLCVGVCCAGLGAILGGVQDLYDANWEGVALMSASSVSVFLAVSALSRGLQLCRAGPGVLIAKTDMPLVYLLGVLFLHEVPDPVRLCGSCLVFCAALGVAWRNMQKEH